jgi:dTDP-glucose 4,6-dehydratase
MQGILITGGAGFIGSCFTRQWLAEEDGPAWVLDKLTYAGHLESLDSIQNHPRFHFVQGDIGDNALTERLLLEHHPAMVINFAAESHVDRSIDAPEPFLHTNVLGTARLLAATHRYWRALPMADRIQFRFLQISTDEVYGSIESPKKISEESSYAPNSPYSASKAAADHFVRAYYRTYGLPTLTIHSSNNYGPRQLPDKLIPLMICNAFKGKQMPIYGNGSQVRDWLHVDDLCLAARQVLHSGNPGAVYHVGGNCQMTNLDVVHAICKRVDRLEPELSHIPCSSLITLVEDRPGHDQRYALDTSKIMREIGWKPRCPFAEGLETAIRWYLANMAWVEHVTSGE